MNLSQVWAAEQDSISKGRKERKRDGEMEGGSHHLGSNSLSSSRVLLQLLRLCRPQLMEVWSITLASLSPGRAFLLHSFKRKTGWV